MYTALGIIAIPVFYIAGAGSTIFWIVGKSLSLFPTISLSLPLSLFLIVIVSCVGASVVLILVHAIAMVPLSGVTTDEEMGIMMEDITIS